MTTPEPFYSFSRYLRDTHGEVLHRVALDPGYGCPHRDAGGGGGGGGGGCTFCPAHGSRAAYLGDARTMEDQVRAGVAFARRRYGARRFMAYVQAYTGTFAPAAGQAAYYERLLERFAFDALSIGTRPDCLPPGTLAVLEALAARIELWVELGLQTTHDATLRRVRRGHDWATGRRAVLTLAQRGIRVAAHVILGLPGENAEHFRLTAERLSALPLSAIKIHNLHIVRGTALAREFAASPFEVWDADAYAEVLIDFLRRLPARLPVMRINTDTPAAELVAPRWTVDKSRFRAHVIGEMRRRGLRQGDLAAAAQG
jgi:radical SAM protein (TIGR01212 family)